MQEAQDFRGESKALHALLSEIDPDRFEQKTLFKDWTINDVLQHLLVWNQMALLQIEDEALLQKRLGQMRAQGASMRSFERELLQDIKGTVLLEEWETSYETAADAFAKADPKQRLVWAGPSMSARSSITARLMETWAHGQEVYDVLGVERANTDRIRGIVVLGINTFGWTYKARGEEPPELVPMVDLVAPSGAQWTYGEPNQAGLVKGSAVEFCQVVTQTRNIDDTALEITGEIAKDWMSKAQCFAGPAEKTARTRDAHSGLCLG